MAKTLKHFLFLGLCLTSCLKLNAQFMHHIHHSSGNAYSEYMNSPGIFKRFLQRAYIGFASPVLPIELKTDYIGVFSDDGGVSPHRIYHWHPDTTITHSLVSSPKSWILSVGAYFGLAKLGKNGEFALNVDWSAGYIYANKDGADVALQYMAFPISLEYKSGGEARLNKTQKMLFTIGAGANTYNYEGGMSATDNGAGNTFALGVVPFAKIELGYFVGVAFKFGATVNLMPVKFWTEKNEDFPGVGYSQNTFTSLTLANTSIKPGVTLSLCVLPYSWDWSNDKWDY